MIALGDTVALAYAEIERTVAAMNDLIVCLEANQLKAEAKAVRTYILYVSDATRRGVNPLVILKVITIVSEAMVSRIDSFVDTKIPA